MNLYLYFFSKKTIFLWIISIIAISYMSLIPRIDIPVEFSYSDKVWHTFAYLWLSFLPYGGFKTRTIALAGSLLMIPLGIGLEIGQSYIPGREAAFSDAMANSIGVIAGIVLGIFFRRYFNNTSIQRVQR